MQAFKLVNAGFVDKVIVFDSLPERLLTGIKTREVSGFPRSWAKFLADIGSLKPVFKTETTKRGPGDYSFNKTPIGKEPCFYVLEYMDSNADKEFYRAISEFLRLNCQPEVRLKEKLSDMAIALAPNSTTALDVEPEDIPVIVVAERVSQEEPKIVGENETIVVQVEQKRRGRPKKVAVEA
jgi:hypothetical protein